MNSKKRAYVSVYNKERIVEFCQYLIEYGYEIVATEGTCKVLTEAGIKAISAHELTGYPEPLGGKIRALHPAIYTGIIANELSEEQLSELGDKDIYPIELVVVNCYPFVEDMEAGVDFKEAASHIDSNGVALLNAAAKNYLHTVVVCDPDDYDRVLCDLAAGDIPEDERRYFMYKAFSYTASYDALVAQYLSHELAIPFPKMYTVTYEKTQDMRYGENPHQRAAVYHEPFLKEGSLARARQLAGGQTTYNNINDANTALELVKEFEKPTVVSVKHCAVSSVGTGESAYEAFVKAYETDPHCMKGCILAVNGIVDARLAEKLRSVEVELVAAVGFTPEAMDFLRFRKDLILFEMPDIRSKVQFSTFDMKKVYGGLLVQSYDTELYRNIKCVTERAPTDGERRALEFNYRIVKHARSSAVVIGEEDVTRGIGTGQTLREKAVELAVYQAGDCVGSVMASESQIVSPSCVELAAEAGITAIIQSGEASEEIVAACNKHEIAMLCTDMRHFKN